MSVAAKQPEVRFNKVGPHSLSGVAYVPKVIAIEKTIVATSHNSDFMVLPAGSLITRVDAVVETAINGTNPTISFGTDGDANALIASTDFDVTTAGNWATNVGSTNATNPNGLYLHAADTLRIALVCTNCTEGKVRFLMHYLEKDAIAERGFHFNL